MPCVWPVENPSQKAVDSPLNKLERETTTHLPPGSPQMVFHRFVLDKSNEDQMVRGIISLTHSP
jgi:hypothetical protein